ARLVSSEDLASAVGELADAERDRMSNLYVAVAEAIRCLGEGDGAGAAEALLRAASLEEGLDHPDRAEAWAAAAVRAAREERDRRPVSLALRRRARAEGAQGKLVEALKRYEEAHEIARDSLDFQGAAEAAIGAGNILEQQGSWDDAETWYRRALDIMEADGREGPEMWHAQLNIHIVLRSTGSLDESLAWLQEASDSAEQIGDETAAPFLENAWGQLRMASGSFTEAEPHFRRGLSEAADAGARVTIRLNLAEALLAQDRTLEATEEAREAEREALASGIVPKLPEVYRILGRIVSAQDNPDAFVFFERALDIVRERRLPALEEALTLQAYAESEARRGEDDAAQELRERMTQRYRALGMSDMRQTWADFYGPGPRPTENERSQHNGETDA
ncbi:MAG: tetratricopeptide repeat protein, partial [Gemmatimonadetes bacterium]|nr:tetratricopeptide repeat protein [Gemmatimonadota bacterium]